MKIENLNSMSRGSAILRRRDVTNRTGLAKSTIYDFMKRGAFPRPVRLGSKIVGWIESEIDAWLSAQVEKSRGGVE